MECISANTVIEVSKHCGDGQDEWLKEILKANQNLTIVHHGIFTSKYA